MSQQSSTLLSTIALLPAIMADDVEAFKTALSVSTSGALYYWGENGSTPRRIYVSGGVIKINAFNIEHGCTPTEHNDSTERVSVVFEQILRYDAVKIFFEINESHVASTDDLRWPVEIIDSVIDNRAVNIAAAIMKTGYNMNSRVISREVSDFFTVSNVTTSNIIDIVNKQSSDLLVKCFDTKDAAEQLRVLDTVLSSCTASDFQWALIITRDKCVGKEVKDPLMTRAIKTGKNEQLKLLLENCRANITMDALRALHVNRKHVNIMRCHIMNYWYSSIWKELTADTDADVDFVTFVLNLLDYKCHKICYIAREMPPGTLKYIPWRNIDPKYVYEILDGLVVSRKIDSLKVVLQTYTPPPEFNFMLKCFEHGLLELVHLENLTRAQLKELAMAALKNVRDSNSNISQIIDLLDSAEQAELVRALSHYRDELATNAYYQESSIWRLFIDRCMGYLTKK